MQKDPRSGLPWARVFLQNREGGWRAGTTHRDLLDAIERLDCSSSGLTVQNMEMEAGFSLHFSGGVGISPLWFNQRATGVFLSNYR